MRGSVKKNSVVQIYKLREFRKYWHCNSQLALHLSHVTYYTLRSRVAHLELVADIFQTLKRKNTSWKIQQLTSMRRYWSRERRNFSTTCNMTVSIRPLLRVTQMWEYYKNACKNAAVSIEVSSMIYFSL